MAGPQNVRFLFTTSVKFTNNDSTGAQVVLKGEDDNTVEVKMVTIDNFLRGNFAPDFGGAGTPVITTAGIANNHISLLPKSMFKVLSQKCFME